MPTPRGRGYPPAPSRAVGIRKYSATCPGLIPSSTSRSTCNSRFSSCHTSLTVRRRFSYPQSSSLLASHNKHILCRTRGVWQRDTHCYAAFDPVTQKLDTVRIRCFRQCRATRHTCRTLELTPWAGLWGWAAPF